MAGFPSRCGADERAQSSSACPRPFTRLERRLTEAGRPSIGGWVAGDIPVLLLTTKGRRSGKRHTTPLLFHRDTDDSLLIIGANGAADWHPDWVHNLVADPHVEVELDGIRRPGVANVLRDDKRAASWPDALRAFPGLAAAQHKSSRDIPLIRLTIDTRTPATPSGRKLVSASTRSPP